MVHHFDENGNAMNSLTAIGYMTDSLADMDKDDPERETALELLGSFINDMDKEDVHDLIKILTIYFSNLVHDPIPPFDDAKYGLPILQELRMQSNWMLRAWHNMTSANGTEF